MKNTTWHGAARWLRMFLTDPKDRFLWKVPGVIHIGANTGQERIRYNDRLLSVLWIEANPEAFAQLQSNISGFPAQRALQALLSDEPGRDYLFHVSRGDGAASSIFDFGEARLIWPDLAFEKHLTLRSTTLPQLLSEAGVRPVDYPALVLDTQGSELLILQGARSILSEFHYIKTEAANFEAYKGCCRADEIRDFLSKCGFREVARTLNASTGRGLSYFDLLFKRDGIPDWLPFCPSVLSPRRRTHHKPSQPNALC